MLSLFEGFCCGIDGLQTTWSSLNVMMRIYKLYDLPLHVIESEEDRVAAVRVAFPAYPGSLFSGDDFYMLSSGLVVQETTIGWYRNTLMSYPPESSLIG